VSYDYFQMPESVLVGLCVFLDAAFSDPEERTYRSYAEQYPADHAENLPRPSHRADSGEAARTSGPGGLLAKFPAVKMGREGIGTGKSFQPGIASPEKWKIRNLPNDIDAEGKKE